MGHPKYVVMQIAAPASDAAHSPTLTTLHRVEEVLRKAAAAREPPLRYAEIARRLPVKKIRPQTVKACVAELQRFHLVAEGSKGVMWVMTSSDAVMDRARVPLE